MTKKETKTEKAAAATGQAGFYNQMFNTVLPEVQAAFHFGQPTYFNPAAVDAVEDMVKALNAVNVPLDRFGERVFLQGVADTAWRYAGMQLKAIGTHRAKLVGLDIDPDVPLEEEAVTDEAIETLDRMASNVINAETAIATASGAVALLKRDHGVKYRPLEWMNRTAKPETKTPAQIAREQWEAAQAAAE